MRLLKSKFRRVFNRNNSVRRGNKTRQDVESRRFAGAGAAAYQNIQPSLNARVEEHCHIVIERAEANQILNRQSFFRELADCDCRANQT